MSRSVKRRRSAASIVSRIVAAVFGGYVLAALASVAALATPLDKSQAVLAGMLASFLIYGAAVIWVFAARNAWRAWAGLVVVAAPLALVAWPAWQTGII